MTIAEALAWARRELGGRSDNPTVDADALLGHVLQVQRSYFYTWPERTLPEAGLARFQQLVHARAAGHPVAHLTGVQEFWSLPLRVTPATLIPRPETELLVELALRHVPRDRPCRVLDLGTGSGAIALALASERPEAAITATDASADALEVASDNARRLGLQNIRFRQGDWYAAVAAETFEVIVSNPPYIGADEPEPNRGDCRFDPRPALIAADNGLADLREIVSRAPEHLTGVLLVEHGYRQGPAVRALFAGAGFRDVETAQDLQGHDRVSFGRV